MKQAMLPLILALSATLAQASHISFVVEACLDTATGKGRTLSVTAIDKRGTELKTWPGETYKESLNEWSAEQNGGIDHPAAIMVVKRGKCRPT